MTLINKSTYLRGLQCHKLLWTTLHQPTEVPAPNASTQAIFDQGREVGLLAQSLFPGGIDLSQPWQDFDHAVTLTKQALEARRPVYEATFAAHGNSTRVDALVPVDGDRWDVVEVKSSTSAKGRILARPRLPTSGSARRWHKRQACLSRIHQ